MLLEPARVKNLPATSKPEHNYLSILKMIIGYTEIHFRQTTKALLLHSLVLQILIQKYV